MQASDQLNDVRETEVAYETEEWGDGDESYDDEMGDEDNDDGADAEAEIARRLGDQLWADIHKARAGTTSQPTAVPSVVPVSLVLSHKASKQEEAAIATARAILLHTTGDSAVSATFSSTPVQDCNGQSVLDLLIQIVAGETISKEIAKPLSQAVLSLSRSETLFPTIHIPDTSAAQLDKGKRKRDELDEAPQQGDPRLPKRLFTAPSDLQSQITAAARIITNALNASPPDCALNPSLISSIQLELHKIFLFAVTSSAGGGPEMNALQEISGLIQVIGVLSGVQIGPTPGVPQHPSSPSAPPPAAAAAASGIFPSSSSPWLPPSSILPPSAVPTTDIGTAVYPCLVPACRKIFSRLYSLRAHQRVHAIHRPFRCNACPASFARNHDLKRHAKLHDMKAWKCCGCDKMFSRRDAIIRHKKSTKSRGGRGDACINAEVIEVDLDKEEGDEIVKEGRRARIWNGIVGSQTYGYGEDRMLEEGEIEGEVIARTQSAVTSLHGVLQANVAKILGIPSGDTSPDVDPAAGQATLASVIARAQLQNLPLRFPSQDPFARPTVPVSLADGTYRTLQQQQHMAQSDQNSATSMPSLSRYGLSDEQTKMLEQAIANAASAAQAQAEAEAALEEEEEAYEEEDGDDMAKDDDDGVEGHS